MICLAMSCLVVGGIGWNSSATFLALWFFAGKAREKLHVAPSTKRMSWCDQRIKAHVQARANEICGLAQHAPTLEGLTHLSYTYMGPWCAHIDV